MAGKPNIRSIRFSDELAELIDRQVGDTFTAKFEALVTRCVWELPQKEAELERLQKQVDKKKEELRSLESMNMEYRKLQIALHGIYPQIDKAERIAKEITEKV